MNCKICGQPANQVKNDANGRTWIYCVPCGIHYPVTNASSTTKNKAPAPKTAPIPQLEFTADDNQPDETVGQDEPNGDD